MVDCLRTYADAGISLSFLTTQPSVPAADSRSYTVDGDVPVSIYTLDQGVLLRFHDYVDILIARDGTQVEVWPLSGVTQETLRHLLLDKVLPLALNQRGHLVVHAGTTHINDRVVGFLGPHRAGKSTLTAAFHLAGYPLLGDDAVILTPQRSQILARPTYPSLRLMPDSLATLFSAQPDLTPMAQYSAKQCVGLVGSNVDSQPLPLGALYLLAPQPGSAPEFQPLDPRAAYLAILEHTFLLDSENRHLSSTLFAQLSQVVRSVPIYTLTFPHDFTRLDEVRQAVSEHTRRIDHHP